MASNNSLLLNVARHLRYRTLASMIDERLTISDRSQISNETVAFIARYVDGCSFAGPEQNYLDGQLAKYGILDLRFVAPSSLLDTDALAGVPLLRELGFVGGDMQQLVEELGGDSDYCLQELHDGIAQNQTHLLVFLEFADENISEVSKTDRMARLRDPSKFRFPKTFTVADACVSNSSFVWMNKHFYV